MSTTAPSDKALESRRVEATVHNLLNKEAEKEANLLEPTEFRDIRDSGPSLVEAVNQSSDPEMAIQLLELYLQDPNTYDLAIGDYTGPGYLLSHFTEALRRIEQFGTEQLRGIQMLKRGEGILPSDLKALFHISLAVGSLYEEELGEDDNPTGKYKAISEDGLDYTAQSEAIKHLNKAFGIGTQERHPISYYQLLLQVTNHMNLSEDQEVVELRENCVSAAQQTPQYI